MIWDDLGGIGRIGMIWDKLGELDYSDLSEFSESAEGELFSKAFASFQS